MQADNSADSEDMSDGTSDDTVGNESDRLPPATTLQGQLNRLLASLGSDDAASVRGVFGAWRELVGDAVADHVQPVKLDRSTLVVEVADPHWATEMRFLEAELCAKISRLTTTPVTSLEVRVKRR
jgi:predicted nucleic acid-binding Zn ribbon protein